MASSGDILNFTARAVALAAPAAPPALASVAKEKN